METDKDELGRRARQRVSLERGLWALRETAGGEASNIKIRMPLCQLVNIWSLMGEPDTPNEFMCRSGGFEIAGVRLEWEEPKPKALNFTYQEPARLSLSHWGMF